MYLKRLVAERPSGQYFVGCPVCSTGTTSRSTLSPIAMTWQTLLMCGDKHNFFNFIFRLFCQKKNIGKSFRCAICCLTIRFYNFWLELDQKWEILYFLTKATTLLKTLDSALLNHFSGSLPSSDEFYLNSELEFKYDYDKQIRVFVSNSKIFWVKFVRTYYHPKVESHFF